MNADILGSGNQAKPIFLSAYVRVHPRLIPLFTADAMVIDCHVHVCAASPGHGSLSLSLLKSIPFRFMQWQLGIVPYAAETEREMERKLSETIAQNEKLDA